MPSRLSQALPHTPTMLSCPPMRPGDLMMGAVASAGRQGPGPALPSQPSLDSDLASLPRPLSWKGWAAQQGCSRQCTH